jgi:hypothetical protein
MDPSCSTASQQNLGADDRDGSRMAQHELVARIDASTETDHQEVPGARREGPNQRTRDRTLATGDVRFARIC